MKNNILLAFITVVLFFGIFSFMHPDSAVTLALKKPFTPKSGPAPWPKTEDAALQAFADKYFYAFRHNDVDKRRAIVTQASLACVDRVAKAYFTQELAYANPSIPAEDFKVRDNGEKSLRVLPDLGYLPETPDTTADIAWTEVGADRKHYYYYRVALKKQNGEYQQVLACPTDAKIREENFTFGNRLDPKH